MDKITLLKLLEKHHVGQTSEEEGELLDRWLTATYDSATEDIAPGSPRYQALESRLWQKVKPQRMATGTPPIRRMWLRYAAAAVILLSVGLFIWRGPHRAGTALVLQWDTVTAKPLSLARVRLPDSSEVYLNAGSSIRYAIAPRQSQRWVELLYGEARFDVRHDVAHPFIVTASGLQTRVLGTRFTISAYPGLPYTTVQVSRGLVQVSNGSKELAPLPASHALRWDKQQARAVHFTSATPAFNPENQSYYLDNATFGELALRIRNTYGYTLHAATADVSRNRFSGELRFSEPVGKAMVNFCGVYGGTYRIKGKEITMY